MEMQALTLQLQCVDRNKRLPHVEDLKTGAELLKRRERESSNSILFGLFITHKANEIIYIASFLRAICAKGKNQSDI